MRELFDSLDALVLTGDQAAELRELLRAPQDANEETLLAAARADRKLLDASMELLSLPEERQLQMRLVMEGDFHQTFDAAVQLGLARERERDYWAERFEHDPAAALEALTAGAKGTPA